jgi:O-antigen ligase
LICVTAPTGWYGADDAAGYALAATAVLAVSAYARDKQRRLAVVVAVSVAGLIEFMEAFLPWWGGGRPEAPMSGTFYWWNPFAAFLLPGALLGAAMAIAGVRTWRAVGWLSAPMCAVGIIFSSSRMSVALLAAGYVALGLVVLTSRPRRRALIRWVLVGVLSLGAAVALSGPPFFDHRASLTAAADAKSASGQSVAQNGHFRLEFWQRATAVVKDRPLVGSGPHALVGASENLVSPRLARSNLAHNGYLQVLSDGGLALGLPFLLACAGCLLAGVRLLLSARSRTDERWFAVAVPVTLAALAAHSAVDFDWSHPSDLTLTAVLAGLALAVPVRSVTSAKQSRTASGVVVTTMAAVLVLASWNTNHAKLDISRVAGTPAEQANVLHQTGSGPLRDFRWALAVLRLGAGSDGPIVDGGVDGSDLTWAVAGTKAIAPVAPDVQLQRARALVVLGRGAEATHLVQRLLSSRQPDDIGPVVDQAAEVLSATGHRGQARGLLLRQLGMGIDEHSGAHLQALIDVASGHYTLVDRCAEALVPPNQRLQSTPDLGLAPAAAVCDSILRGATS